MEPNPEQYCSSSSHIIVVVDDVVDVVVVDVVVTVVTVVVAAKVSSVMLVVSFVLLVKFKRELVPHNPHMIGHLACSNTPIKGRSQNMYDNDKHASSSLQIIVVVVVVVHTPLRACPMN
jgi:hypothetical protein